MRRTARLWRRATMMADGPFEHDLPDNVQFLVRQLLLERTQSLDAVRLSAYLDGWSGMLDLMRRTDLLLPNADPEVRQAVTELVNRILRAQHEVLDDGTG